MIWSSRARNRSPDFVASCFFGRIARHSPGEQAPENHGFRFEGIKETSLQASRATDPKTLQSRTYRDAEKTNLNQRPSRCSRTTGYFAGAGIYEVNLAAG